MNWTPDKPLRTGDTWTITVTENSNYPNSEYVPNIRFRGPITFTLSGTINSLSITVTSAVSKAYTSGFYDWVLYWTKTDEQHTDSNGNIEILPNLLALQGGVDTRSHARKMVTLIEAALEKFAEEDGVQEVEINGRRYVKADVDKLKGLLEGYRNEVAAETSPSGKRKKILYRFPVTR